MNTTRTFARRRWLALAASFAVVLGIVGGAVGGAPEPASAADPVPTMHAALLGDQWLPSAGGTLIERVTYENLEPGFYVAWVFLLSPEGVDTVPVTPVRFFTPTPSGTVDVNIIVPGGYAGRTLIATASLSTDSGTEVGTHEDLTDPLQTAYVLGSPAIHGAIVGDFWYPSTGWIITERVSYQNLTPRLTYEAFVMIQNPDGSFDGIADAVYFRPTSPSGTVDVQLVLPASYAGRTVIATVSLTQGNDTVARQQDLTDPLQTLIVRSPPAIRSSLTDRSDGDRELSVSGGDLIDVVSYENLDPGTAYTISGVLMRGSDATASPLTSDARFTPTESNGTVELPYTVPPGYAGESLVSFDRLYAEADTSVALIAEDTEIDDPTQTVTVARADAPVPAAAPAKLAATGLETSAPLGLAAATLLAGALLLLTRRRRAAR